MCTTLKLSEPIRLSRNDENQKPDFAPYVRLGHLAVSFFESDRQPYFSDLERCPSVPPRYCSLPEVQGFYLPDYMTDKLGFSRQ
ncbi:hypothetical protein ALQ33_200088 [Pseudomonas syringae pv. philadelphi]|uniref:Uncharacterized protein n=1 Tax=Pseudomonas syringae pv. philadelphi TaxID=251706 RepID=A0A3M3YFI4_9PSED|nr:hypothetical protein ALQ33_200088 [Pseudomonas syringae pv. philadelphi]